MATDGVRVTGLREFTRYLERIGVAVEDLAAVMADVGELIASAARPLTRPQSGVLAGSIRPSRTKSRAVVRAGNARTPYAGVQHFGWAARNIAPKLYLYDALDRRRADVLARFDTGINNIINNKKA